MTPVVPPPPHSGLGVGWRWVVGLTWAATIAGLSALVNLADYLGKSPVWSSWALVVLILPMLTVVAAAWGWTALPWLSLAATLLLAGLAVADLATERPGVALVEGLLALAGLLVSVAALGVQADQRPGA